MFAISLSVNLSAFPSLLQYRFHTYTFTLCVLYLSELTFHFGGNGIDILILVPDTTTALENVL